MTPGCARAAPQSLITQALPDAPRLCSFSPDELHEPKDVQIAAKPSVRFNLRVSEDPEHEGCYLPLGHNQPLEDCGFNMTAKTFFIIHGWAVSPGAELCSFPRDSVSFVLVN